MAKASTGTAKEKQEQRDRDLIKKARAEGRAEAIAALNTNATTHPDQVASAHGEKLKPQPAGEKVIVGCKLGIAYFNIQLCEIEEVFQQNMQGGRMVKEARRIGPVVQLRGTAYPRGTAPEGFPERPEIVGGATLNRGIDRDFMEKWLKQNALNPIVKNQMIFVAGSDDAARGLAMDLKDHKSGLDPINPKSDPRLPKPSRGELTDVEPGRPAARTA